MTRFLHSSPLCALMAVSLVTGCGSGDSSNNFGTFTGGGAQQQQQQQGQILTTDPVANSVAQAALTRALGVCSPAPSSWRLSPPASVPSIRPSQWISKATIV